MMQRITMSNYRVLMLRHEGVQEGCLVLCLASRLEVVINGETLLDCRVIRIDTLVDRALGVSRYSGLEEVGLSLQRDHLHKVKGVGVIVDLFVTQSNQQSVCEQKSS